VSPTVMIFFLFQQRLAPHREKRVIDDGSSRRRQNFLLSQLTTEPTGAQRRLIANATAHIPTPSNDSEPGSGVETTSVQAPGGPRLGWPQPNISVSTILLLRLVAPWPGPS
jgi:hypothetical protein